MAAIIPEGRLVYGMQLPIQSQSTRYVQPWETDAGIDELVAVARACDRAGFFYVGVCDHVAIPRPHDESMSTTWWDTTTTLGYLAAVTEHTHLLSHVYVLPYRHPLVAAKAWATLDAASKGRAILGVAGVTAHDAGARRDLDHHVGDQRSRGGGGRGRGGLGLYTLFRRGRGRCGGGGRRGQGRRRRRRRHRRMGGYHLHFSGLGQWCGGLSLCRGLGRGRIAVGCRRGTWRCTSAQNHAEKREQAEYSW